MNKTEIIMQSTQKMIGASIYQNNLLEALNDLIDTSENKASFLSAMSRATAKTQTEINCRESELLKKFAQDDSTQIFEVKLEHNAP